MLQNIIVLVDLFTRKFRENAKLWFFLKVDIAFIVRCYGVMVIDEALFWYYQYIQGLPEWLSKVIFG